MCCSCAPIAINRFHRLGRAVRGGGGGLQSLISHGANAEARNAADSTPLISAATAGNVDALRMLIDNGEGNCAPVPLSLDNSKPLVFFSACRWLSRFVVVKAVEGGGGGGVFCSNRVLGRKI